MRKAVSVVQAFAIVAALGLLGWAQSQTLPVCQVSTDSVPPNCSASGWASGLPGFVCAHRTITCTSGVEANGTVVNIVSNGITIGYAAPSSPNGTIVFLSYGAGAGAPTRP